jgi:hypothetical protein
LALSFVWSDGAMRLRSFLESSSVFFSLASVDLPTRGSFELEVILVLDRLSDDFSVFFNTFIEEMLAMFGEIAVFGLGFALDFRFELDRAPSFTGLPLSFFLNALDVSFLSMLFISRFFGSWLRWLDRACSTDTFILLTEFEAERFDSRCFGAGFGAGSGATTFFSFIWPL